MNTIKKLFFGLLVSALSCVLVSAQNADKDFYYGGFDDGKPTTVAGDILREQVVQPSDGVLKRTLRLFDLDQYTNLSEMPALEFIKFIINIILSLTSLVALIVIVYAFAKVFFAKDDDAMSDARKTVQGAAIAIAIIAISRLVVTFLFSIYESVTGM